MNFDSFYTQMDELTASKTPYLFLIDFENKKPVIALLSDLSHSSSPIRYCFPHITNDLCFTSHNRASRGPIKIDSTPLSLADYSAKLSLTKQRFIELGVDVINLTTATPIETSASLAEIYQGARAKYKVLLKDEFVSFSPETFVQIDNQGIISCFPMKGTIDANLDDAIGTILNSPKEEQEHRATVNAIQDELATVADEIHIKRYRYIDQLTTSNKSLLQVSSEVTGVIKPMFKDSFGKLFKRLLPAGSIVGAPKEKALQIITEVEAYTRGYYTGVCGIYDGETLDSCVLIRYIESGLEGKVYKSGGGVTLASKPESEYNEIKDKIYVPLD